ncbi:DUF29 domain-containing protein [Aurantimonas sp. VKM B-3413]|uniref:DUF29 domain-containing protein n=1 Tax=Aurantimonas sp. VKM B-3413 TaxID=2779401 RepID=UPI001E4BA980|nr:DUF29 domain-containing protein [Aurantimonas sp. VKM B-3413]MCB8838432.1 DUF29 domain-containing protein [Aurantimonas sp. VKM B-3413]
MSLAKDKPGLAEPIRYDEDFTAWAFEQAQLLRRGEIAGADLPNLVEEIESLGNEQIHALELLYTLLIFHLLKWQFQPDRRSRSWDLTSYIARAQIARRERRNPSLRARAGEIVDDIYAQARGLATKETRLPIETFPAICPYTLELLREQDAMPECVR